MSQFVDECQLNVKGGDGGAGCISFRREGPVVMGGTPTAAMVATAATSGSLPTTTSRPSSPSRTIRTAKQERGVHGKGKDQHGRRGDSITVKVPIGTKASDLYTGEVYAELNNQGDRWLAAGGGRGGTRECEVPVEQAASAELRRAGRTR